MEHPSSPVDDWNLATSSEGVHSHNESLPIHQLPPELLQIIIGEAYDQKSYRDLFTIRSVCKYWMEIVDSMHELWTRVSLKHDPNLLSMILEKSSTQPLSVSYKEDGIDSTGGAPTPEEKIAGFLRRVTPSAGRWKSLEYWARSDAQHDRILGLPLHNLQTLLVQMPQTAVNYTGVFDAPRLRDLGVYGLSLNWRSFANMRSLQIDGCVPSPSVDEVHTLLKTSPNLEVLKIARIRQTSPIDDTYSAPIHLPRLKSLLVAQVPFVHYSRLLDLIEAQNLRRFVVFHHFDFIPGDFTPMFESAGRFLGTHRQSSDDDDPSRLRVFGSNDTLATTVGNFRIILKNYDWTQGTRKEERPAGLAAILRRFDRRLCQNIRVIRFSGMQGDEEMVDLAHILHRHFPSVQELVLKFWMRPTCVIPILGRLSSPLPHGENERWLFPKLIAFHLEAPNDLVCDGILEVVEARQNVGQVQAIQQFTIEGGNLRRDTVAKLKTYLRELHMTGTKVT
ncbi:hypothetical protein FRC04_011373 [Tulasnella sp. 424]|nr:hypothetical protein FRC04_011373 [Tulasnella sp. 424]KAG8972604.1 hypothetical protein FRC05_009714 [Tulasnella sp. 425]